MGIIACLSNAQFASAADNAPAIQFLSPFEPFAPAISLTDDHRWSCELLGTALGDVTNRHVAMGGLTAGAGYYFLKNMSFQLDVTGYGFNEGHSNGAAAGVTLGIRHHLFEVHNSSIFVDCSGGEIEASNNVPRGGTHLNNTLEAGLGVATPIKNHLSVLTGVRYFHLSNAQSEGADRNPSVNAIQGVLGLEWRF